MAKNKSIAIYILYFSIQITILIIIEITLRKVRELFPPSQILQNYIVGYSQYFGYPYYFDTLVFLAIMLSPIIISLILAKIKVIKWKK